MHNTNLNSRFLDAVRESYANYNEHGSRSNKKLRPIHQWVADELQDALEGNYVLESLRKNGEGHEETIAGKYYDKNVDISISNVCDTLLAIISVKFVTSNFKQNANNYFEHLLGETANIRLRNVVVGHLMVLPNKLPYLKKDKKFSHLETIKTKDLQKYVHLVRDENHPHRPDVIGVGIISLPVDKLEDHNQIELMNMDEMCMSKEVQDALSNEFSVSHFICTMKNLVEAKDDRKE